MDSLSFRSARSSPRAPASTLRFQGLFPSTSLVFPNPLMFKDIKAIPKTLPAVMGVISSEVVVAEGCWCVWTRPLSRGGGHRSDQGVGRAGSF